MTARKEQFFNPLDLEPDIAIGVLLPFSNKNGGLFELSYTTEEQAMSNLRNLLLTRKGERLMHPLFGSNLYSILFEQNSNNLADKINSSIRSDIEFWLPNIIVEDIVIDSNTVSGHDLSIELQYRVTAVGEVKTLLLNALETGTLSILE